MVSGDYSVKKSKQLSLIVESYINKESEKQLISPYDQFISSQYVAVSSQFDRRLFRSRVHSIETKGQFDRSKGCFDR